MYLFPLRALAALFLGSMLLCGQQDTPPPDPQQQVPAPTPQPGVAPAQPPSQPEPAPQSTTPPTTPETPDNTKPDATANPNDNPARNPVGPPEVIPTEPSLVPAPESTGPGVLTRGFTVTPLENQTVRFRPFLTISGLTDSGLTGISVQNGAITSVQSYGLQAGFGISGRRVYKRDTLELEFRGDVYRYTPNSEFDGGNYVLNLTYQHYFSRHYSLVLTESGSLYSNNYSLLNSTADLSVGNTQTVVTPNTQLFDNQTVLLNTGADLVIQKTSRLSFDLGGTGFLVRRESSSLYGTVGAQARADVTYRWSRRLTLGAYYAFSQYSFNRAFGGSNVESGGAIISYTLSRGLELRLRGGGSYVSTVGVQTVQLDPIIAAILGVSTGTAVIRTTNIIPDISAQLFKIYPRATGTIEFVESVTPGNGLFLTSRHTGVSGYYNYTGVRRWTFSLGAGRDTLSTLGILIGQYTSNTARGGITRMLTRGFQANAFAEYRRYDVSEAGFLRNAYRINIGIAWSPSERPLKLW